MNFFTVSVQVIHAKVSLALDLFSRSRRAFTCDAAKPAYSRIVVVSTRIGSNVRRVVMRQIDVPGVAAECKLQNPHPRKTKFITEGNYVGSNHPQVFRDNGQAAKRFSDRRE